MSEDLDNQVYNDWVNKPFHFTLMWSNDSNILITNDTGEVVSKAIIMHLHHPHQIERKGFLTDHVIGRKIKFVHPAYMANPDEFADAIVLFVFGIFPTQLSAFGVTLDGEPFNWKREFNKYLYG